jgi:hypothetical protein
MHAAGLIERHVPTSARRDVGCDVSTTIAEPFTDAALRGPSRTVNERGPASPEQCAPRSAPTPYEPRLYGVIMSQPANLFLPGTVVVLKLIVKVFVAQEVRTVEVIRALIAFPTDLIFLSLAFGSAILYNLQVNAKSGVSVPTVVGFTLLCCATVVAVTGICMRSDKAFTTDKNAFTIVILTGLSYGLSALALYLSFKIAAVI